MEMSELVDRGQIRDTFGWHPGTAVVPQHPVPYPGAYRRSTAQAAMMAPGSIWASGFGANELLLVTPISTLVIDYAALRPPRVDRVRGTHPDPTPGEHDVASAGAFPAGSD